MERQEQIHDKSNGPVKKGWPVYESREALEEARLMEAINRTDTEKFKMFIRMMRITLMLKKAAITHK